MNKQSEEFYPSILKTIKDCIKCSYGNLCKFKDTTCPYDHNGPSQVQIPCHHGVDCKKHKLGICSFSHDYKKLPIQLNCFYNLKCTRSDCTHQHATLDGRSPAFHQVFISPY